LATIVIPARFGSQRLPGKPLAEVSGRPLIVHVLENARKAASAERVIVATDDERIAEAVRSSGCECVMTSPNHATGTDRVAEVARDIQGEIIVNLQGDEPEMDPATIDAVVDLMKNDPDLVMTTAATPINSATDFKSPHVVKVVVDRNGRALYFSRAPIPYWQPDNEFISVEQLLAGEFVLGHLGIYAYRREALFEMVQLEQSPLEQCESLEQLRALQNGMLIGVAKVETVSRGIDVPEDLEAFRRRMEDRSGDR